MEMLIGEYGMTPHHAAFRLPMRAALALTIPRRARLQQGEGPNPATRAYGETRRRVEAELRRKYRVLKKGESI